MMRGLIIMGSNTYNAEPFKPSRNHFLVIMTRHPEKYKSLEVPGQSNLLMESPLDLLIDLKRKVMNK